MLPPDWASVRRAYIHNEETNESWPFVINPENLTVQISVNWTKAAALGASFERMHYRNTANATFDLIVKANRIMFVDMQRGPGVTLTQGNYSDIKLDFESRRNFLMSLCYPRGRQNDVLRRSPPTCLLVWPGYLAVRAVMRSLQMRDTQFAQDGSPVAFEAACQFEEYRTYRLTSAEVLAAGFIRKTTSQIGRG